MRSGGSLGPNPRRGALGVKGGTLDLGGGQLENGLKTPIGNDLPFILPFTVYCLLFTIFFTIYFNDVLFLNKVKGFTT